MAKIITSKNGSGDCLPNARPSTAQQRTLTNNLAFCRAANFWNK